MTCPELAAPGQPAIAQTLRAVDCMAAETTQIAFGRLFGSDGAMTATLTIGLTIYVALFAIGLLTGRASLNLAAVTPRMMGLGIALTFATSWVAYSSVIWNLLSAGPDWIAAVLLGIKGSASEVFAHRLDLLFAAVADAADKAREAAGDKESIPADLLSYSALLLLVGTVGVLVTSRIALAALLASGPVFLVLSLFAGTRGLFEGWAKAAVMFALVPLFTVLIGAASVGILTPVVAGLAGGAVRLDDAASVFVAAVVHCALMILVLKLVTMMTANWQIPFGGGDNVLTASSGASARAVAAHTALVAGADAGPRRRPADQDDRVRSVVASSTRSASLGDSLSGQRATIIRLPGASIVGGGVLTRAANNDRTSRAENVGRALRKGAPPKLVKETLP